MNEIIQLKKKVVKQAATWALFMFVFMEFISKALIYKEPIILKNVLISIPIWIIAGCIFGLIVFYFEKKKIKNK